MPLHHPPEGGVSFGRGDKSLSFKEPPTKKELLKAMEGHILGWTQLVGKYRR